MIWIVAYLAVGVLAAIISDALIGWDIESPKIWQTNPGPVLRATIVVVWPFAIAVVLFLLFDDCMRYVAKALRKRIRPQ